MFPNRFARIHNASLPLLDQPRAKKVQVDKREDGAGVGGLNEHTRNADIMLIPRASEGCILGPISRSHARKMPRGLLMKNM